MLEHTFDTLNAAYIALNATNIAVFCYICGMAESVVTGLAAAAAVVTDLAVDQWGYATAAQLLPLGISRAHLTRLTAAGTLRRVHHGIYRIPGWPADRFDPTRLAWIAADAHRTVADRLAEPAALTAVVSHESAAALHRLGDLPADQVELSSSRRLRLRLPDLRIHPVPHLDTSDWTLVDGLPVTTAARTIADLAAARVDGDHLAAIVRDALQRDLATGSDLAAALDPHAAAYGQPTGRALLDTLIATAGISSNVADLAAAALPDAVLAQLTTTLLAPQMEQQFGEIGRKLATSSALQQALQNAMPIELRQQFANGLAPLQQQLAEALAPLTQQLTEAASQTHQSALSTKDSE